MDEVRRWNVFVTVRGPGGSLEVPSSDSPISCDSLRELLEQMDYDGLPAGMVETVGIRIEEHADV